MLAASSGIEALALLERHEGDVQLLMTDVVMPKLNGKQLCKVTAHHGELDPEIHFLQQPISAQTLASKVREVLDG